MLSAGHPDTADAVVVGGGTVGAWCAYFLRQAGLRVILARELHMPEAELEMDRPFAELGMNSVMAMSVRRDTELFVGIELSATMLFNYPTIVSLAGHLAKKLLPQPESDSDFEGLGDSDGSVLSELFDAVESAPAGSERGM